MGTTTVMLNVTNNTSTTTSPSVDLPIWFKHVIPVCIMVIGLVGNTLAIATLRRKNYRKISTCYYMIALACTENFIMILFFVRWLNRLPGSPIEHSSAFCVGYFFCVRLTFGTAAWTLMLMSLDRFLSIRFPLQARSWCTVNRARISLVVIVIIHFVSHIPYFWRYSNEDKTTYTGQCPYDLSKDFVNIYIIVRMVVFDRLLPWLAILSFSVAMSIELYYDVKKKDENLGRVNMDKEAPRRVTAMSLVVAWVFFILTFPTSILEGIQTFDKEANVKVTKWLYELFVYLLYFNSAINFYLYIAVARKFRADVKNLLCCRNKTVPRKFTNQLTPSSSSNSSL